MRFEIGWSRLLRLWHTLRYLRCKQLLYRPWRMGQYWFYRHVPRLAARWHTPAATIPAVAAATAATFRRVFENFFAHLHAPLEQYDQRLIELRAGRFTFLNCTLELAPLDWNRRYESHLWNYQLHYFSYALCCARAFVERGDVEAMHVGRALIESWTQEARLGRSDGWDAYPVSLRVVNWIYAYALVAANYDDQSFLARWRTSIYGQLNFLSQHLEYHLLANHLLKNAKALVIGGLFFQHEAWLRKGERLLWRELAEQVLGDGGHYERAPMYHAIALGDLLECFALLKAIRWPINDEPKVAARLRAMAGFLEAMSYPDGTLARFNDSANNEEARPQPLLEAARQIVGYESGQSPAAFSQTGYYSWASRDGQEKIIVDAGEPSVSYNTAHAHCDLLSYELWLAGQPFIIDSGVHGYGGDRFREYCRSTRAHNTVMFDGQEQSEVWSTFRMARRAQLLGVDNIDSDQLTTWNFRAAYRPYHDQQMIHERRIRRLTNGEWYFEDCVTQARIEQATSFIHLHPAVTARKQADGRTIECVVGARSFLIAPFARGTITNVAIIIGAKAPPQGWYFPDFGIAQPSATVEINYQPDNQVQVFGYIIKNALD